MSGRIALSWVASQDDIEMKDYIVERCSGGGCTNFSQLTTTIPTSYNDDTVVAGTTYRYRVRARDAAGNLSAYSTIAEATATANEPAPDTGFPDFHLQSGSSACHAGIYVAEVQYDKDGRQRPNPPSIGAYEGNCPLP